MKVKIRISQGTVTLHGKEKINQRATHKHHCAHLPEARWIAVANFHAVICVLVVYTVAIKATDHYSLHFSKFGKVTMNNHLVGLSGP